MDIRTEGAHVDEWRDTVIAAIEATRPADEMWSVTATEVSDGVVAIDFARSNDAPRSLTLARPGPCLVPAAAAVAARPASAPAPRARAARALIPWTRPRSTLPSYRYHAT